MLCAVQTDSACGGAHIQQGAQSGFSHLLGNISKVTDVALSDHYCVFFERAISMHTNDKTQVITKPYITENTSEILIQALSSTPALSWVSQLRSLWIISALK